MAATSLFERLGGSSAIATMVDGIVAAHLQNPVIRARFQPYLATPDRLAQVKAHLCAFLEAGSGGPCTYTGRTMVEAHRGMNINETEFVSALDDILEVMRRHGVDQQTRNEVLAIAYSLKDDILHV